MEGVLISCTLLGCSRHLVPLLAYCIGDY
uniref:Uncharacterized protein n=1 Tax=Arundo donax TaxID=35708 RepID=A0A0A9GSJ6_ARUDO